MVEQKKREKEEERLAKQRVREQIEQDKLMRKAKFGGNAETVQPVAPTPVVPKPAAPVQNYKEVQLQIRLTNGKALVHKFQAKEPLSAVKLYIELNRTDEPGPFNLMVNFPKKVFVTEDYDKPLDVLGKFLFCFTQHLFVFYHTNRNLCAQLVF